MILRKPYAFLIKHFRLIHLIISILMCFIIYKSYILADFYDQSVANNYMAAVSGDIAGRYINYFMYLGVVGILGLLIAIYYLLSHKDKPRKFYAWAIICYIVILVLFSVNYNFVKTLSESTVELASLRTYRDISYMIILPQIVFMVYFLVCSTGFNIKKFNFDEDLKELQIEEEDNEEFEVTFGKNNYKRKRDIRRFIREFRYYILENKFVFTVISIIVGIIIVTSIFLNYEVYNKKYSMDDTIAHNYFSISVLDSIISPYTYNGDIISNGKYYIAVKINVKNITSSSKALDYSNFRVVCGNKNLTPILEKSLYFMDFAEPYYGGKIKPDDSKTIALIYEIDESEIKDTYQYKILRGSTIKPGEIVSEYSEVTINPVYINEQGLANEVELNEKLDFNYSNIGNSSIKLKSYVLTKNYQYSYEKCLSDDKCLTLNDAVAIDYSVVGDYNILIAFDYEFNLDKDCLYYKTSSNLKNFVNNYMTIEYTIGDQTYSSKVIYRDASTLKDKFVVQTATKVSNAESISAVFTIRNKKYVIKLK